MTAGMTVQPARGKGQAHHGRVDGVVGGSGDAGHDLIGQRPAGHEAPTSPRSRRRHIYERQPTGPVTTSRVWSPASGPRPARPPGGRPEAHPRREIVDAIRYVVDTGCKWSALPSDFPPRRTCYGLDHL